MSAILENITDVSSLRCIVLSGDDTVSREHAREEIIAALTAARGPLGHVRFDSGREPFALFAQRLLTPSLFQETRVASLRHAQTLGDGDLDELNAVLDGAGDDIHVIVEIDEGKKGAAKIIKKLRVDERCSASPPSCFFREFIKPPEYKIAEWLVTAAPLFVKRRIAKNDAEYLVDRVGYDVDLLYSELQKIDLYLPPDKPVSRAAIDHVTERGRQMTPFELAAAVGRQDFPQAVLIIRALFSVSVYMPLVVSALARHFWALLRIKKFLAANPEVGRTFEASKGWKNPLQIASGFAIGKAAGLMREGEQNRIYPVLIKSGVVDQARGFSDEELSLILGRLLEFDTGVKTGRIEPTEAALQLLCYSIVRARALPNDGGWA